MEIAEQLQHEAAERAGSPEGLSEVLRLILETIEGGTTTIIEDDEPEQEAIPNLELAPNPELSRPEWLWPEQYLPTFRKYVALMQAATGHRLSVQEWQSSVDELEFRRIGVNPPPGVEERIASSRIRLQRCREELEDTLAEAKRKKRELPIHAYKRLIAMEKKLQLIVQDRMYDPIYWKTLAEKVEGYISQWGVARKMS